jgi:ferredoxin--NADP+ reductase
MSVWAEGEVKDIKIWNDNLFTLYINAEIENYKAGQFTKLSSIINEKRIARAYSFVNNPNTGYHEFYITKVLGGALTPFLADLNIGDKIEVYKRATGFFTVDEVPESDNLWLFATGTALGVFLSLLSDQSIFSKFKKVTLVHAVRNLNDLAYNNVIANINKLTYIPIISREKSNFLSGRIPKNILNYNLQNIANQSLTPSESQVMICGNPDMLKDTQNLLISLNFKKNLKRESGQITVERYW